MDHLLSGKCFKKQFGTVFVACFKKCPNVQVVIPDDDDDVISNSKGLNQDFMLYDHLLASRSLETITKELELGLVSIADDAVIFVNRDCKTFLASKLTFEKRIYVDRDLHIADIMGFIIQGGSIGMVLLQTLQISYQAIHNDISQMEQIRYQPEELAMFVVNHIHDGPKYALEFIRNPSEKVCIASVTRNPESLSVVKRQTPAIVRAALFGNENVVRYVDHALFQ